MEQEIWLTMELYLARDKSGSLYLYKGKWLISYFDDEYIKNYKLRKNICSLCRQ